MKEFPELWKRVGESIDYNIELSEMSHNATYKTYLNEPWEFHLLEYGFNGDGRWHMSNTLKLLFSYDHRHEALESGLTEEEGKDEYRILLTLLDESLKGEYFFEANYVDYDPGMSYATQNNSTAFVLKELIMRNTLC